MWDCLQHINARLFDPVKGVLCGTRFLLKYTSVLSPGSPAGRRSAFKKRSVHLQVSLSPLLSLSVLLPFSPCCLHHFAHSHIISSSSQIAVAQGNCICWSDLAWLTPPPQKYEGVRVVLAWAGPSLADWVVLLVTGQDNHISKYSPLLSPSPLRRHYRGPALFSAHARFICVVDV